MIIERDKLLCLIVTVIVEFVLVNGNDNHHLPSVINTTNINDHDSGQQEARSLFSPRIDYNEWMPVGRGDPLKNDPTYDYSPPVLDRVRYWGDRDTNKDKKEILLLGVPSKRQTHKKETNHSSSPQYVRRNFYSSHALHHLPTRLLPPPVQTLSPTTKQTSTESYHNLYNHLSNYNSHLNHNWNINSVHYDSHPDESINFISFTRTERPSNLKSSYSNNYGQYYTTASRKPWIYELLQKEITKPSSHLSQAIPSTSPLHITPLTPSHSSTYSMTPSKNVFESHTSLQPTSINYVTASFTTEEPEPTYFQPTIPTTSPSPITTSTFSYTPISHKKKEHHEINSIHGPMYLIIQGHSKVKTYGLKDDSANNHQPKIVPIAPKEENIIIKHVTSKDDNGKAVEIKHLHKKTTELPLKEKLKVTTSATTKKSTTISTTTATTNITTTTEEQSPMKNLLSLLDTSFGSFFGFDNEDNNKTAIAITTKKPDTSTNNINKNCTSATDATTINDIRERRQIFDYDQLPESSIKTDDENYDYDGTLFASEPKSSPVQIKSELNSTEIV